MYSMQIFAFSAIALLISCKSALQDSATLGDEQTWEVKRLESPLIVFNWSTGSGNLVDHLSAQIDQAAKLNLEIATKVRQLPRFAIMGMGLYVANDPLLSNAFGNELSCLELKEDTEILKAKDAVYGTLDPDVAISRTEPGLIYDYGPGIIPLEEGGSTSAVIRVKSIIDLRKSKKIDFSKPIQQNLNPMPAERKEFAAIKLDDRALRRAVSSLNSGKFCEALQVFEGNLPALYYSSLAGVRAIRPLPKNERRPTYLSSQALFTVLIPQITDIADSIFENKEHYPQIRQDLIELKLLKKGNLDNEVSEKLALKDALITALYRNESEDWNAKKVSVMAQLINLSNVISIPTQLSTAKDLSDKITEAFDLKLINWGKENRDDFEFSKKLWKHWNEHSISSFVAEK